MPGQETHLFAQNTSKPCHAVHDMHLTMPLLSLFFSNVHNHVTHPPLTLLDTPVQPIDEKEQRTRQPEDAQ